VALRRALLPLAVAALACCLALVAADAQAAYPGKNGRFVFEANGGIYTVRHDGSKLKRIAAASTAKGYIYAGPAWSPSGDRIAYNRDESLQYRSDIFTMEPNGTDRTRVTNVPGNFSLLDPSWSPDGQQLVVTGGDYDGADPDQLYTLDRDGSALTQITNAPVDSISPAWSPKGNRILLTHGRFGSGSAHLRTISPTGTQPQILTYVTETVFRTDWAPGGGWIAYAENGAVYKIRADGTDKTRLAGRKFGATDVAWSPNGKRIAFDSAQGQRSGIYKMRRNGSKKKQVLSSKRLSIVNPDWQSR